MGLSLDKIEINGFKSFAEKVNIKLDRGVTVIVGPNGSGKSNIVDAIRWVLGEKSAKVLRGTKMEDVIFSGVEDKKAKSFCEVALTFDNTDGQLPIDFSEVCVTRRVYRNGEGEYLINQSQVRRRDIVDLFRDTGIGKEGYSIIGQGRVDEILSPKSEDRRTVLEDAAGISKYKSRKVETERKLQRSQENLSNLYTVLSELESQLGPLEVQSKKAEEYLLLRDQAKLIDVSIFVEKYSQINSSNSEQKGVLEQLKNESHETSSKKNELEEKQETKEYELSSVEERLENANAFILEKSTEISRLEGEEKLLEQKQQNSSEQTKRVAGELVRLCSEIGKLEEAISSSEQMDSHIREKREALEQEVIKLNAELESLNVEIKELERKIENKKNEIMAAVNNRANTKIELNRLENMISTLLEKKNALLLDIGKDEKEFRELKDEMKILGKSSDELISSVGKTKLEDDENRKNIEKKKDERFQLSNNSHSLEKELQIIQSRKNLLSEMKKDYEGYYYSVKRLMKDIGKDLALNMGIIGVVGELIEVPVGYETAIEMALGASLQSIVCEDENSAKKSIEYLRKMNYGRATFLPLTTIRSRNLNHGEAATLNKQGVRGVASALVRYDEKHKHIVENLLGRIIIVDDLDVGISLARANRNSCKIVSLKGDTINSGGSMSGGSLQKKESRILGRDKEISNMEQTLEEITEKTQKNSEAKRNCERVLAEFAIKRGDIASRLDVLDKEKIRFDEKKNTLESLIKSHTSDLEKSNDNLNQVDGMVQDIKQQIQESKLANGDGDEVDEKEKLEIENDQKQLFELRNNRESLRQRLSEKTIEKERIKNSIDNHELEKIRITGEITINKAKIDDGKREIETLESSGEKLLVEKDDVAKSIEEINAELGEISSTQKADVEKKVLLGEEIKNLNMELQKNSKEFDDFQNRIAGIELKMHKEQIDLENLQERIWNDYEMTYDSAIKFNESSTNLTPNRRELESIRSRMRSIGDVSISSIEDFKNVNQRYQELCSQKDDIIEASNDLKKIIAQLESKMSKQFREEFTKISTNFAQTFRKLFGGGKAELRMENADDALNCEIEIVAQPPGKNLQLMSLLSGGERALTAISLLFAMLQLKATPFCVLDEIEASLDEANVDRFAEFVKEYSKNTQFIMVTHRKGSMIIGEVLYGVAMEGTGMSRMVSVKMSEAEKMLEA